MVAQLVGMDPRSLLRARDPVEVTVLMIVAGRVAERQQALEEARIHRMANEVARRFG